MKERANEKLCRCCDAFKAWKAYLNWSQMGSCANLYTSGTPSSRSYRICLQTYQWRPCSTFIRVAVTIRRAVWVWQHLKTSYNILNCFVYRTSSFFILRETVRWQQHYSFLAKKEWCDTEIRFIISFRNWNKMFLWTFELEIVRSKILDLHKYIELKAWKSVALHALEVSRCRTDLCIYLSIWLRVVGRKELLLLSYSCCNEAPS